MSNLPKIIADNRQTGIETEAACLLKSHCYILTSILKTIQWLFIIHCVKVKHKIETGLENSLSRQNHLSHVGKTKSNSFHEFK